MNRSLVFIPIHSLPVMRVSVVTACSFSSRLPSPLRSSSMISPTTPRGVRLCMETDVRYSWTHANGYPDQHIQGLTNYGGNMHRQWPQWQQPTYCTVQWFLEIPLASRSSRMTCVGAQESQPHPAWILIIIGHHISVINSVSSTTHSALCIAVRGRPAKNQTRHHVRLAVVRCSGHG